MSHHHQRRYRHAPRVLVGCLGLFSILLFSAPPQVEAQNLRTLLTRQSDISTIFLEQLDLHAPTLASILENREVQYTLFVPSDEGVEGIPMWNETGWASHIAEQLKGHFVPDELLTRTGLTEVTQLETIENATVLQVGESTVGGANFVRADLQAVNGILHIMDGPVPVLTENLADVVASEYPFLSSLQYEEMLSDVSTRGYTWIGCNEAAWESTAEDEKTSFTAENFVTFNRLYGNTYPEFLSNQFRGIGSTDCASVWITNLRGNLCFNDACTVGDSILASNGLVLPTDLCMKCPGVATLAAVDPEKTLFDTSEFVTYFRASGLDQEDLRRSTGGQAVTMFASLAPQWSSLVSESFDESVEGNRFLEDPQWQQHTRSFVESQIAVGAWTLDDLFRYYQEIGNEPFELETLDGGSILIDYEPQNDRLLIGEGDLQGEFFVGDLRGIDGYLHLTTHVPLLNGFLLSVWDVIQVTDPDRFSQMISYIASNANARLQLSSFAPRSAFVAPDTVWDQQDLLIEDNEIGERIIRNHVFTTLVTCDSLRAAEGTAIRSITSISWTVSINGNNMPCLQYSGVVDETSSDPATPVEGSPLVCVTRCDIPGENGMFHIVDNLMTEAGVVAQAQQPTPAPTTTSQPTFEATSSSADFDLDTCLESLSAANGDANSQLLRPEYYQFISGYGSAAKCIPTPDVLSERQNEIFLELACRCQETEDEGCCEGPSAPVVLDEDTRAALCERVDRSLGEDLCAEAPTPIGSSVPPPTVIAATDAPVSAPVDNDPSPMSGQNVEVGGTTLSVIAAPLLIVAFL